MEHEVVQTDADRYVIVEYIAEGGMGAIFLGKKVGMEGFEKEVVLKQLLPEFTSQPEFIDLFLREAKLSASLDHANIVHTIDLVAAGEDYFIVMEYVRGGDLRSIQRRVKQRGHQIHPAAAIFIAREVLSALAYAHDKKGADGQPINLIHRDVSPSNIMVSGAGEVKLTDFGIAKVSTHKSVFYRVKGKVGYMSPEQAYGDRPLDHRSDLYSVAVCLYEMLSGERLFVADLLSTPDQIYNQKVARLEDRPEIPHGIDDVLARALALDRDDRYQTALDLQDALVKVAYDNGQIFTAPDLASHLKQVCGDDPTTWNHEDDEEEGDHPGTEVLSGDSSSDGAGEQFSGVELTSVFTGLPEQLGPEPQPDLFAPAGSGQTRHLGRRGIAYAPTRLANDPTVAARRDVAFDVSDAYSGEEAVTYPPPAELPANVAVSPLAEAPTSPTNPLYGDDPPGNAELLAELSGIPPDMEDWPTDDEEGEPTVAVDDGHIVDLPPPHFEPGPGTPAPTPSAAQGPIDQEETVELRVHASRMREEQARHQGEHRRAAPMLTAQVERETEQRKTQRHRTLLIVAASLLLLSGVAIVILVGLTGPDLEDDGIGEDGPKALIPRGLSLSDGGDLRPVVAPPSDLSIPRDLTPAQRTRSLKVESSPSGAKVYLDEVFQCRTPCTIEELEEDRIYLLSVQRKRYVSWSSLVDMQGKDRVHVNAYLSKEPEPGTVGYLLLRATPRSDVYVDGKEIGKVTSEGRIPLPPGQYEITLHHPRRQGEVKRIVTIHARQTMALWIKY